VRVIWPDGRAADWQRIDSDHFYILEKNRPARLWP
jgi:enediyne biosynthesis protein E4